jgi:hypothetical protein
MEMEFARKQMYFALRVMRLLSHGLHQQRGIPRREQIAMLAIRRRVSQMKPIAGQPFAVVA